MDVSNRLLALAVYVAGIVAVAVGSYFVYRHYQHPLRPDGALAAAAPAAAERTKPESNDREQAQAEQIRRLQLVLEQKTQLLQKGLELLEKKNAEQAELRAELDAAIALLETLTAAPDEGRPAAKRTDNIERLQGELETLRTGAEKSKAAAQTQQTELSQLQVELEATDARIAQLEQEAAIQVSYLREQREAFEAVAAATLVRVGEPAVPALVEQLGHSRPGVRRWAATTLGLIGPAAKDALPALIEVLGDKDAEVRPAVKRAIELIDVPVR